MLQVVILCISAAAGAALFGYVSETNTLLGIGMGAALGAFIAISAFAFPSDIGTRGRDFGSRDY